MKAVYSHIWLIIFLTYNIISIIKYSLYWLLKDQIKNVNLLIFALLEFRENVGRGTCRVVR